MLKFRINRPASVGRPTSTDHPLTTLLWVGQLRRSLELSQKCLKLLLFESEDFSNLHLVSQQY